MRETRNECRDCDCRTCSGCPFLDVEYLICDRCGAEFPPTVHLYSHEGDELCEDCYLESFPCITLMEYEFDEDVRGYCEKCGCDAEELYNVDDEWLCKECALKEGEIK